MDIITIDGMVEHDFRLSVEDMLRLDQVDAAVERLCALIEPFAGANGVLPPCFRGAAARRVEIGGWRRLEERLAEHDRKGRPITAIGVTLADGTKLGGPGPERGRLAPFIKTFYFSDEAYPFSGATREDLLDGYSRDGFEWQGDYQATDATLSVRGLDDLYGPIVMLEARLLSRADPDPEEIRAGTIGACLVAALIHRALRDAVRREGLPRPLCMIAACDGVYPYFDAPVAGVEGDDAAAAGAVDEDGEDDGTASAGSLLNLISRRPGKVMALTLDAADAEEALRYEEMAGAQRLEVHGTAAMAGTVDLSHPPEAVDGSSWEAPQPPAREPIPEPPEANPFEPSNAWWSAEILGRDRVSAERQAFDPTYDPPRPPAARYRSWEEIDEAETASVEPQPAEPSQAAPPRSSHSLRAQFTASQGDEPRQARSGLAAFVAWFQRLLLRC